jgi:hypothetical protein
LPFYLAQRAFRCRPGLQNAHLLIALADHFEPAIVPGDGRARAARSEQERRLERWCKLYPRLVEDFRDVDGHPFCHTYFYPAEQYDKGLIDQLAEHCRAGWGEIEVHLHHGCDAPDTPQNTQRQLVEFRNALAGRGCLSRMDGEGLPRYAFVHGNWALANSTHGPHCGVDCEMQILTETGCYADLTLPSAPNASQTAKINALYECSLPLDQRAPHRRGTDLRQGRAVKRLPIIIQGPLLMDFRRRERRWLLPAIENGALTRLNPPSLDRLKLWTQAAITVKGRPKWIFIKLHCHGMDPRDDAAMLGAPMRRFLGALMEQAKNANGYRVHFVSAREMANIIFAACDGREGNPGEYRDYRLRLIGSRAEAVHAAGNTVPVGAAHLMPGKAVLPDRTGECWKV